MDDDRIGDRLGDLTVAWRRDFTVQGKMDDSECVLLMLLESRMYLIVY